MHRHTADEKYRAAEMVGCEGHHGAEGKSRKLPRMCGEAADQAERSERTRAFRERGFPDIGSDGPGAGMLLVRHGSMVASFAWQQLVLYALPLYRKHKSTPSKHAMQPLRRYQHLVQ
jgi:hypothetical protein